MPERNEFEIIREKNEFEIIREKNEFEIIREKRGLSQAGIANELGISQATYHRWETGKSKPRGLAARAWEALRATYVNTYAEEK